jgi:hypothetical protein
LEKQPERRFHSAHDLGFALEAVSGPSGAGLAAFSTALPAVAKTPLLSNARLAWLAAALLLATTLGLAWAYFTRQGAAHAVTARFTIAAPEKASALHGLALSPDGRSLAFAATVEGKTQLWLRPLDAFTARPLPGTENSEGVPFWSPDSRSLAFRVGGKLKKIDLANGTQRTLCEFQSNPGASESFSGTWNRAGDMLIFRNPVIYRIPAKRVVSQYPCQGLTSEVLVAAGPTFYPTGVTSSITPVAHNRKRRRFISPRSTGE